MSVNNLFKDHPATFDKAVRDRIQQLTPSIITSLHLKALKGDTKAATILLNKVLVDIKEQPLDTALEHNDNATIFTNNILALVCVGKLSTTQADRVLQLLSKQQDIEEMPRLIEQLEKLNG